MCSTKTSLVVQRLGLHASIASGMGLILGGTILHAAQWGQKISQADPRSAEHRAEDSALNKA